MHIPFCSGKCRYCGFYSVKGNKRIIEDFKNALIREINRIGSFGITGEEGTPRFDDAGFDSVYIGGGTPTVLPPDFLEEIVLSAKNYVKKDAEITVEANPADDLEEYMKRLADAGVNRVSFGLQSGNDAELQALGRRHTARQAEAFAFSVKNAGIKNFSADIMLGIPGQTEESLEKSLNFAISLGITHLSCYMLKIEENTPFWENPPFLPDEDSVCRMYLQTVQTAEDNGLMQYEISNFARPGFESRHNLHYWNCDEYLGLGPAAHSFLNGKRFYYPESISDFIKSGKTEYEGTGGDFEEYAMLRLRLAEGLLKKECEKRFKNGGELFFEICQKARRLVPRDLINISDGAVSLTPSGFLVSNLILSDII